MAHPTDACAHTVGGLMGMRSDIGTPLRRRARGIRRAVTAAVLAVLAAVAAGTGPAGPAGTSTAAAAQDAGNAQTVAGTAPMLPLYGLTTSGHLRVYEPTGTGGWQPAVDLGSGYSAATALFRLPVSRGGAGQDLYIRLNNYLYYTAERGDWTTQIGSGWNAYNLMVAVGDMGGTAQPDMFARDPSSGYLWLYQTKPDGTFLPRVRVGTGWNGMNALVGYGDYTGDGKADLLARNTTGTLYIYPGTGSVTADKVLGTRITVGTGWGTYKALLSTGDNDGDGRSDLIASDTAGALWLFKGTGDPAAPFAARRQIGTSGWTAFTTLF